MSARRPRAGAAARRRARARHSGGHQQGAHLPPQGNGFPAKGATGDMLVAVRIVLPEDEDDALAELMKEWGERKPYGQREALG